MHNKSVVLIDDDSDDHEIFSIALQDARPQAQCLHYYSANEALEQIKLATAKPDYIFLDVNMPRVNGIQFLESIKSDKELANIPVIVYSTSILPQHKQKIVSLGAYDIFVKPSSHSELIDILTRIIQ
jgi:CheY-like chemotaxis protein